MTSLSRQDACRELSAILDDGLVQAEALQRALADERAALEANDADALVAATAAKAVPLRELAALDARRAAVGGAAGFEAGPDGVTALIGWCDEGAGLEERWGRLVAVARDCERRNHTNGAIVRARRHQVLASLAILTGGEVTPETYEPSGIEANPRGGRALAQA